MADAEKIEETEEEMEGEKSSNKLLLIAFLVIGLGLGGGGAYFIFNDSSSGRSDDAVDLEELEEKESVEALDLKNVVFEGMAVPVHNSRGKYIGNYKVSVRVLTENDNDNVRVKNLKFKLRQAFISRIAQGGFLQENSTNLDYDKLANSLKDIAKNIVGQDLIYGVVIEDVVRVNN